MSKFWRVVNEHAKIFVVLKYRILSYCLLLYISEILSIQMEALACYKELSYFVFAKYTVRIIVSKEQ